MLVVEVDGLALEGRVRCTPGRDPRVTSRREKAGPVVRALADWEPPVSVRVKRVVCGRFAVTRGQNYATIWWHEDRRPIECSAGRGTPTHCGC